MIPSNLGQIIGTLALQVEGVAPPQVRASLPPQPKMGKREQILAALRGNPLTIVELHAVIGGSRGSLSVYLAHMHTAGELRADGEKRPHRYSIA